jgi:hypothetical protein
MTENPYEQGTVPDGEPEPKPDPVAEAIKAAKLAAEAAERNSTAMTQMVQQQRRQQELWAAQNPYNPQPPAVQEPDPEIDPDIQKVIDRRLERVFGQIEQAYTQDRQADMRRFAAMEFDRASRALPNFGTVSDDVRDYLNRAPLHLQAAPGAVEEAYYAVMGRRYAAEEAARASRAPAVNDTVRSANTGPQVGNEEVQFFKKLGVEMTKEELAVLANRDVNSDQWFETVSKKGDRNG